MTKLQIRRDDAPDQLLLESRDATAIQRALAERGVRYERWPVAERLQSAGLSPEPERLDNARTAEQVLLAFAPEIARLKREGGYSTADVVQLSPDHPDRHALRQKFLSEHRHSEDEVRFFVSGAGLFSLHIGGEVLEVLCEAGDLLAVPARTPHWFDMGEAPAFVAIRLFQSQAGWLAEYSGSAIAAAFSRFPSAEQRL